MPGSCIVSEHSKLLSRMSEPCEGVRRATRDAALPRARDDGLCKESRVSGTVCSLRDRTRRSASGIARAVSSPNSSSSAASENRQRPALRGEDTELPALLGEQATDCHHGAGGGSFAPWGQGPAVAWYAG